MTDSPRTAWAWGLATVTEAGQVLDAWYPEPRLGDGGDAGDAPAALVAAAASDD